MYNLYIIGRVYIPWLNAFLIFCFISLVLLQKLFGSVALLHSSHGDEVLFITSKLVTRASPLVIGYS